MQIKKTETKKKDGVHLLSILGLCIYLGTYLNPKEI